MTNRCQHGHEKAVIILEWYSSHHKNASMNNYKKMLKINEISRQPKQNKEVETSSKAI